MKKLFILLMTFASTHSFAQTTKGNKPGILMDSVKTQSRDTALRVIYLDSNKTKQQTAFFINGVHVINQSLFDCLDPNWLDQVNVVKRDTLIENIS